MINTKRIAQLAKKWQRMADLGRKRLSWGVAKEAGDCCTSMDSKGHCVVYTADKRRFEVPLAYLGTRVFAELLQTSQEEFSFVSNGRITLPCDAAVMVYAMRLLGKGSSVELEKAFLSAIAATYHYASCVALSIGVRAGRCLQLLDGCKVVSV